MNGKQVRIKKEPINDWISVVECIERKYDPVWLHKMV
jgi:hypothetical protein